MLARCPGDTPPKITVPEWCERLVCSQCGSREVDMVVIGTERAAVRARHGPERARRRFMQPGFAMGGLRTFAGARSSDRVAPIPAVRVRAD
jgi:hypothetical protein